MEVERNEGVVEGRKVGHRIYPACGRKVKKISSDVGGAGFA